MTGFGIYILFYWLFNLAAAFFYIGKGGMTATVGSLWLSVFWTTANILGLLLLGTGLGVL